MMTVHTFTALGQYLAADVNSGAVHVLDELTYDLLCEAEEGPLGEELPREVVDHLSKYDRASLEEGWLELLELQKAGLLFTTDDYLDPEAAMALPKAAVVKALCLHVSHDCNLRCRYCFASTGDFGTGHRMTMNLETAKKAIDWVVAKSGKRRNIEIDFFGGEPLMALDTVKQTVRYARSLEEKHDKVFRFTITTNGILLDDETIDYINREMSNVVLSLDGRQEINDKMRPTANGKGSYDIIVPKFQKLVAGRGAKDYYVRGTFTRNDLDFTQDVLHMGDLGFRHVSVEPCSGPSDDPYAIRPEDLSRVEEEYEILARALMERHDINFFHFNVDLSQGPCVIKRLRGWTSTPATSSWGKRSTVWAASTTAPSIWRSLDSSLVRTSIAVLPAGSAGPVSIAAEAAPPPICSSMATSQSLTRQHAAWSANVWSAPSPSMPLPQGWASSHIQDVVIQGVIFARFDLRDALMISEAQRKGPQISPNKRHRSQCEPLLPIVYIIQFT